MNTENITKDIVENEDTVVALAETCEEVADAGNSKLGSAVVIGGAIAAAVAIGIAIYRKVKRKKAANAVDVEVVDGTCEEVVVEAE